MDSTIDHLNVMLVEHKRDSAREFRKVLHQNNVDIDVYHGGSINGNHCMCMAQNADAITDTMTAGMGPKIKDPVN